MNIEEHLIFIKGEDKTEEISRCMYEHGKWQVKFANDKSYSYKSTNVKWFKSPVSLNPETTVIYDHNQPLSGVKKIFVFSKHIRICYESGYKKVYRREDIKIEKSCLNKPGIRDTLKYLKQLAEKVSVANDEESNFLSKQ